MSFNLDFLTRQADPADLGAVVLRQSATIQQIGQGFVRVNSLDEIAATIGELQYRAADANGKVRMIMSAINLLSEFGVNAHLAGIGTNGLPQFWASSDDGSLNSGGGTVKMDTDGITINNIGSALQIGTNGGRMELLVNGQGIGKLIYYSMDGTELVLNGTFESGSLSDWTTVSGSPVVQGTTFKHGAYALKFTATGAATTEIVSSAYINVIADRWYVLQAWAQYTNAASQANVYIDWYTSGNVLISTSQINLNQTAPIFTRSIEGVYSPATAAKVKIRIKFSQSVADTCYVDTVSFQKTVVNEYGELLINDPNKTQFAFVGDLGLGLYDHNGNLLWDASKVYTYDIPIPAHGNSGTIAASTTVFAPPFSYGLNASRLNFVLPRGGTLKNLRWFTNTAQPATGSLVATVDVNNAASALTATVAAGGAAQSVSDLTHSVTVNAGDAVTFKLVNNATGVSAQVGGVTCELEIPAG